MSGSIETSLLGELSSIGLISLVLGYYGESVLHNDLETRYPNQTKTHQNIELGLSAFMLGLDALTFLVLHAVIDAHLLQGVTPVIVAGLLPGQIAFAIRAYQHSRQ